MELILFFLGVLYDLPGSAFADALESGLIVPALEPMCYADVWRQVAVPVRNVTSLCGGQTSGSSSSRMPSSTRRWTSVAEYSRQGRGSGTHLENFWGARKLFGADPNFSLKWLWSLPVDSTVLYVYSYTFSYCRLGNFASYCYDLIRYVPVGSAVNLILIGSDRIHYNTVNGLGHCILKWTGSDLKISVSPTKLWYCRGLISRCSEKPLTSRSNSSFLECPPPTAEARVRFPAGTCQFWDIWIRMEMTIVIDQVSS